MKFLNGLLLARWQKFGIDQSFKPVFGKLCFEMELSKSKIIFLFFLESCQVFLNMPGIKITDKDRQRIDAKFICTSCKMLLYLPMQTMCGHLMCQSCIEDLLKYDSLLCSFLVKRFCVVMRY